MKKICIIWPYFGKLPLIFPLLMESCRENPTIDWLLFTDQEIGEHPQNVIIHRCTLKSLRESFEQKLGFQTALTKPYKLCDFKPAYPYLFQEYVSGYDFVGYGDMDVIYGDLRSFFADELLEQYDKLLVLGHLSLIKNTSECTQIFKNDVANTSDYKAVFTSNLSRCFDEQGGINEKFLETGHKVFRMNIAADIDLIYQRFRLRCVDSNTQSDMTAFIGFDNKIKNYSFQAFYHTPDGLYRVYYEDHCWKTEAFAYIHYRKKKFQTIDATQKYYWITARGMVVDERLRRKPSEWVTRRYVWHLNPCLGMLEKLKFLYNMGWWPKDD